MEYWVFDHRALLPFLVFFFGIVTVGGGGVDLDDWSEVCLITTAAGDWSAVRWVAAAGDWLEVRWVAGEGGWLTDWEYAEWQEKATDWKHVWRWLIRRLIGSTLMLLEMIRSYFGHQSFLF